MGAGHSQYRIAKNCLKGQIIKGLLRSLPESTAEEKFLTTNALFTFLHAFSPNNSMPSFIYELSHKDIPYCPVSKH